MMLKGPIQSSSIGSSSTFPNRRSREQKRRNAQKLPTSSYPSWRDPADTKGPFNPITNHLDCRCSVDEPPALQKQNVKGDGSNTGTWK
ncbi:hypothetical protein L5515_002985 [Caenorhabditis briggsae]|uniref:Uncharacterized protein n=1 Tax=Caenorhabditis briggsae TaxID=6238 RepID=A0AAE9EDK5_CAEBR|nr:hypothetical protein L5515_002985 [Caenorhabditis briggsae]